MAFHSLSSSLFRPKRHRCSSSSPSLQHHSHHHHQISPMKNPKSFPLPLMEELLLKILEKLPDISDHKSWRLVCKEFFRIETLYRKVLRLFRPESLPRLLQRYQGLQSLDLSACPRLDDEFFNRVFVRGRFGLKSLNLCRACGITHRGLEVLVKSCPDLEEIDLSYCWRIGDLEASALSMASNLRNLKLVKCLKITDIGLAKIAIGCSRLVCLSLKWCMEITDLGIELLGAKCKDLKSLDISYLTVTNKSLHSISSLRKLEDLSMVACSFVDDDGLAWFENGSDSLKKIDVSRCDNVSSTGLLSVMKGHQGLQQLNAAHCFPELTSPLLSKLKDLRSMNSIRFDGFGVSTSILKTISANCKDLVEIGLGKCSGMVDRGIIELVTSCNDLRTIDLTCCHHLTDVSISAIADCCRNLRCLKLESCGLITEKGLHRLSTNCSFLQEIDLTDCNINDTGLEYVSRFSELMDLKLGLCVNISDKGLFHIGSKNKKLRVLDLYRCTGIGDDGLAAIAGGCRKLKRLNICYCQQITDNGIKHLSGLDELLDLEMRGLVKVSNLGVAVIAIGCKSLVELDMKRCYFINDVGLWAVARYTQNLRQINISYCSVSDVGLYTLLEKLKCLQDVKMVHLVHVSLEGFVLGLRACSDRVKKVKLLSCLKYLLPSDDVQMLQACGCKLRWMDKPFLLL